MVSPATEPRTSCKGTISQYRLAQIVECTSWCTSAYANPSEQHIEAKITNQFSMCPLCKNALEGSMALPGVLPINELSAYRLTPVGCMTFKLNRCVVWIVRRRRTSLVKRLKDQNCDGRSMQFEYVLRCYCKR